MRNSPLVCVDASTLRRGPGPTVGERQGPWLGACKGGGEQKGHFPCVWQMRGEMDEPSWVRCFDLGIARRSTLSEVYLRWELRSGSFFQSRHNRRTPRSKIEDGLIGPSLRNRETSYRHHDLSELSVGWLF